MQMHREDDDRN